jgi:hypothetical protein
LFAGVFFLPLLSFVQAWEEITLCSPLLLHSSFFRWLSLVLALLPPFFYMHENEMQSSALFNISTHKHTTKGK